MPKLSTKPYSAANLRKMRKLSERLFLDTNAGHPPTAENLKRAEAFCAANDPDEWHGCRAESLFWQFKMILPAATTLYESQAAWLRSRRLAAVS